MMLDADSAKRPLLSRVLQHPFLTGKKTVRLAGDKAEFDGFISYRVGSDLAIATRLYDELTARGFKIWFDKKCLEAGVDWKEGFCAGLANSRTFISLLSRGAINNPQQPRCCYPRLTEDSPCDNVLLEQRLALELCDLGLIDRLYPVLIGDFNPATQSFSAYFEGGCHPVCPAVSVGAVEVELVHHFEFLALGSPLSANKTVRDVVAGLTACQGGKLEGSEEQAFSAVAAAIDTMLRESNVGAAADAVDARQDRGARVRGRGTERAGRGRARGAGRRAGPPGQG